MGLYRYVDPSFGRDDIRAHPSFDGDAPKIGARQRRLKASGAVAAEIATSHRIENRSQVMDRRRGIPYYPGEHARIKPRHKFQYTSRFDLSNRLIIRMGYCDLTEKSFQRYMQQLDLETYSSLCNMSNQFNNALVVLEQHCKDISQFESLAQEFSQFLAGAIPLFVHHDSEISGVSHHPLHRSTDIGWNHDASFGLQRYLYQQMENNVILPKWVLDVVESLEHFCTKAKIRPVLPSQEAADFRRDWEAKSSAHWASVCWPSPSVAISVPDVKEDEMEDVSDLSSSPASNNSTAQPSIFGSGTNAVGSSYSFAASNTSLVPFGSSTNTAGSSNPFGSSNGSSVAFGSSANPFGSSVSFGSSTNMLASSVASNNAPLFTSSTSQAGAAPAKIFNNLEDLIAALTDPAYLIRCRAESKTLQSKLQSNPGRSFQPDEYKSFGLGLRYFHFGQSNGLFLNVQQVVQAGWSWFDLVVRLRELLIGLLGGTATSQDAFTVFRKNLGRVWRFVKDYLPAPPTQTSSNLPAPIGISSGTLDAFNAPSSNPPAANAVMLGLENGEGKAVAPPIPAQKSFATFTTGRTTERSISPLLKALNSSIFISEMTSEKTSLLGAINLGRKVTYSGDMPLLRASIDYVWNAQEKATFDGPRIKRSTKRWLANMVDLMNTLNDPHSTTSLNISPDLHDFKGTLGDVLGWINYDQVQPGPVNAPAPAPPAPSSESGGSFSSSPAYSLGSSSIGFGGAPSGGAAASSAPPSDSTASGFAASGSVGSFAALSGPADSDALSAAPVGSADLGDLSDAPSESASAGAPSSSTQAAAQPVPPQSLANFRAEITSLDPLITALSDPVFIAELNAESKAVKTMIGKKFVIQQENIELLWACVVKVWDAHEDETWFDGPAIVAGATQWHFAMKAFAKLFDDKGKVIVGAASLNKSEQLQQFMGFLNNVLKWLSPAAPAPAPGSATPSSIITGAQDTNLSGSSHSADSSVAIGTETPDNDTAANISAEQHAAATAAPDLSSIPLSDLTAGTGPFSPESITDVFYLKAMFKHPGLAKWLSDSRVELEKSLEAGRTVLESRVRPFKIVCSWILHSARQPWWVLRYCADGAEMYETRNVLLQLNSEVLEKLGKELPAWEANALSRDIKNVSDRLDGISEQKDEPRKIATIKTRKR